MLAMNQKCFLSFFVFFKFLSQSLGKGLNHSWSTLKSHIMSLEEYIATMELKFIMFLENNSKVNVMHLYKTMVGFKGF
jgi:hypothetical protein